MVHFNHHRVDFVAVVGRAWFQGPRAVVRVAAVQLAVVDVQLLLFFWTSRRKIGSTGRFGTAGDNAWSCKLTPRMGGDRHKGKKSINEVGETKQTQPGFEDVRPLRPVGKEMQADRNKSAH